MPINVGGSVGWLFSVIRGVFIFIDAIIYSFIRWLFQIMIALANFEMVGLYEEFESRIYVILGIFMLFKVVVSMLTYLVNPDTITDKQTGAAKMVTKIMVSLVMLIMLPTFFDLATDFQNRLLPVVPRIVIGAKISDDDNSINEIADNMTLTLLEGFASQREGCSLTGPVNDLWDLPAHINDTCDVNGTKVYSFQYVPLISTLVGVLMLYVAASMCISVAIRAFKLLILRAIAPIPVVSYMDPKQSKDGMFNTWIKTFGSTWAELFINLGTIYLIVFLIDYILTSGIFNMTWPSQGIILNALFLAFLFIGLFMFAKEAPKFVMTALGIKSQGGFMKMLGMGATAAGGIGSAIGSYRNRKMKQEDEGQTPTTLRNMGAALLNGIGGLSAGGSALLNAKEPNFKTGIDAIDKYNTGNINRIQKGSTVLGRAGSMASLLFTGQTTAEKMELRAKSLETAEKEFKDLKSTIESRFNGDDKYQLSWHGKLFNWLQFDKTLNAADNGDKDAIKQLNNWGFSDAQAARMDYEKIHKEGYKQFTSDVVNSNYADSTVMNAISKVRDAVKGIVVNDYDSYGKIVKDEHGNPVEINLSNVDYSSYDQVIKPTIGDIASTRQEYVQRDEYKAAMADASEIKKGK